MIDEPFTRCPGADGGACPHTTYLGMYSEPGPHRPEAACDGDQAACYHAWTEGPRWPGLVRHVERSHRAWVGMPANPEVAEAVRAFFA